MIVENLYNDGLISTVRVLTRLGHNPVVHFNLDLSGRDPRSFRFMVLTHDSFQVGSKALDDEGPRMFLHTPRTAGILIVDYEILSSNVLWLEDTDRSTPEHSEKVQRLLDARGGR
jgi:hypothetical protein